MIGLGLDLEFRYFPFYGAFYRGGAEFLWWKSNIPSIGICISMYVQYMVKALFAYIILYTIQYIVETALRCIFSILDKKLIVLLLFTRPVENIFYHMLPLHSAIREVQLDAVKKAIAEGILFCILK